MSYAITSIIKIIQRYWFALTVILLTIITVLSFSPLDVLPKAPGGDKFHHVIAYAALMLPTAIRMPKHWLYIAIFFVAWSGAIELIQPYVNRYASWEDLLANMAGLVIGLLIGKVFIVTNKKS